MPPATAELAALPTQTGRVRGQGQKGRVLGMGQTENTAGSGKLVE